MIQSNRERERERNLTNGCEKGKERERECGEAIEREIVYVKKKWLFYV